MIRIFKFKKNDLNPSGGKQIEYSISDVKDFFQFTQNEETVEFRYMSILPNDPFNGLRFKSTFKLSPARGDYKCYGNPDGSLNLKSFFLEKLHLSAEENLEDAYGLKKIAPNSYAIAYFPKDIDFSKVAPFFFSQNTFPEEIDNKESHTPLDEPLQIIFYGAPGTGKSHKIDNDPHVTDENTIRTTFHPDSDYSTFVGAYKPTMAPMPVNAFVGTTVHHAKNADNEKAYEKKIVYKYVPQAFLKAYVAAWSDLDNPYFLVIEEINRGDCAQIFGDLFQLLDRNNMGSSSYAIHADEDITQFLAEDKNGFANLSEEQKDAIRSFVLVKDSGKTEAIGDAILSGKKLLLPPNLYIWATMNTSDQSLFPIDSAFKRRWNWEYMPIDYDAMDWQFEVGGKHYLWSDFLKKMNPLIYNLTQSSDKQMGYFFAKADKKTDGAQPENNLISEKIFLNKVLFYLWTDVLKDFEAGDKIFRDEEKGQMYQFCDFFPTTNGKLTEFVGKLGLKEVGNADDEHTDDSAEEANDTASDNLKLTVIFPDGEKIVGDTKFDSYSQTLKKIGLDRVEAIAAEMKYKRKGSPLVSLDQKQAIVDAPDYTYVTIEDFNLIKGMNGKTMRNFIQLLSDRLNLDLQVIYE